MTPAVTALRRAGVAHEVRTYQLPADALDYGPSAAAALGLDPAVVAKTLVAATATTQGDALVVAVVPVMHQLDLRALAGAVGAKRASMADPKRAERATGYVVGGISPLGQRARLTSVIDASLLDHDVVWVSGGRRGVEIGLAPGDLVRLTDAIVSPLITG
jgi:Cys-tRNA(Pro)/Cys-tRNA(Cys) deacylase